jgi:DNA-binding response OmpR family regulator
VPGPSIVVIDDEESIHQIVGTLLRDEGFETLHASTLRELTHVIRDVDVAAFIVDLNLGTESGLDILRWLRLQPAYADVPALVLTGLSHLSDDAEALIRQSRAFVFYKAHNLDIVVDYLKRLLIGGARSAPRTES